MNKSSISNTSRRDFLVRIAPGCVLSCAAVKPLLGSALLNGGPLPQEDLHKFDIEMGQKITYKQWMQQRHNKYIGILKHLEKDIGKEKLLDMLKRASYEDNVQLGKRLSSRIPSLKAFAGPFRDENSGVGRGIVREIVEDTESAFEMRITACLTEIVFREADALDLGYACVCHADFGLPVGLNPKLKLMRTKTLMQGHDCCNHRYVWASP